MAGSNSGFNRQAFIDGIHVAMTLGAPPAAADQAKFYFPKTGTSTHRTSDDVPWDPAVARDVAGKAPVMVPCAVEYAEASDQDTALGISRPTSLRITLLEDDYTKIKGCGYVVFGGDRYDYRATATFGLFDAGIRTLYFTRSDV